MTTLCSNLCALFGYWRFFALRFSLRPKTRPRRKKPPLNQLRWLLVSEDFKTFKEAYAAGNQALKDYKLDEAAVDYGSAEILASSDNGKSQAANAQGWAYWKAKKLEEAKKAFGRAVEENGDNKVALKNLGVVSYRMYEYGLSDLSALKDR